MNLKLNIKQVSEATGIPPHRINSMIQRGLIPSEQDGPKGHRKILFSDLERVKEADDKIARVNRGGGAAARIAELEERVLALETALGINGSKEVGA